MTTTRPSRRTGVRRGACALCAAALVPALIAAPAAAAPASGPRPAHLLPMRQARPVPVYPVRARPVRLPRRVSWRPGPVRWPAPGSVTVTVAPGAQPARGLGPAGLARLAPGTARAGSLPVWIGPAATAATARVRVTMAPRAAAKAAGLPGVIFGLSRADTGTRPAAVRVTLSYAGFSDAFGGDYGSRLRLVRLPACALVTPAVSACRARTLLPSANNAITSRVGAVVTLPASGSPLVLGTLTATSGPGGDYSATPLSEAGSWAAGGSSGAFSYSYPIRVPPVPGGLAPPVTLSYNSQVVDGLTSSTNSQASWIGDGWDYSPGFIERSYETCSQDKLTPALPAADSTGDLCWSTDNMTTLRLNGINTTLVDDTSKGWHAMGDTAEKITYVTGGSNGTSDGGYWKVTTPDGTSYYFGRNELPGWKTGYTTTDSAWTAPVYCPRSGDPCYKSDFAQAHAPMAWRWNLDYVVDPHGDAIAYLYDTAGNAYAADNATTATATYTRAGALHYIWYGFRDGAVYNSAGSPAGPGEVVFGSGAGRTDVPSDLACTSGAACQVISPSFWTKYQLQTIATYGLNGTTMDQADSWALAQHYQDPGDNTKYPPLWLDSVTRTGQDGSALKLPPVTFTWVPEPNRVETQQDITSGYPQMPRERIQSVISLTGAVTTVSYDSPPASCTDGHFPPEDANATVCYPDWWTPQSSAPFEDWFNKYVVTEVTQQAPVGGPEMVAKYCYGTSSDCLSGGAWRYNDMALTRDSQRTWDQWRGFGQVSTSTGTAPDPITQVTDRYFQGMDGDHLKTGGTSSASLSATVGGVTITAPDKRQWAGMPFEHITYDGQGGPVISDAVTTPWTSGFTADQKQNHGLPDLQAFITGTAQTQVFTALASGGYRESDVSYGHDPYGQVTSAASVPNTSNPSEDTCTQTAYASNTSTWLLDLPKQVTVTNAGPSSCPVTGTPTQNQLVSDKLTFYDGATSLSVDTPAKGDVTMTQQATSYSGGSPVFTTESTAAHDQYGRVTSATNPDGHTSATAYTPATGAEPTSITATTDPGGLDLATTTTYDPLRDLPLQVTNPAGWVTANTYDSLGRLTAAWSPGHGQDTAPADATFSYAVSATVASVITSKAITTTGSYITSTALYDSFGRQVETQTFTPDGTTNGGRVITDLFYNSDGWKTLESAPYYAQGPPSSTLVQSPGVNVPSQTGYAYDGAGRVTKTIAYHLGAETWETDTAYGGDYTTVTPPTGGTAQTTYTDGRGLTSYIYQYHSSPPPASPPSPGSGSQAGPGGWDQTGYGYDGAGRLTSITDAAGSHWAYGYDLVGDQTSATAPDTGTTTSLYDPAGNQVQATTPAGTVSYKYDNAGRKTAKYAATVAAQAPSSQIAAWVYDTLAKGQPTSATSYTSGNVSGQPYYTQSVTGYTPFGLPSGTETYISAGPLAGAYKRNLSYSAYADLPTGYYDYGAGGLPAEGVSIGYDAVNRPDNLAGIWNYVASVAYTPIGQPQEYALGTTSAPVWLQNAYDPQTDNLTTATILSGTVPATVDNASYGYDPAGNLTSVADAPAGGPNQVQCYQYDYADRLSQAWAQGNTPCAGAPSQSAEAGAAAGYWNSYTYNTQNDLTQEVSTPPSGAVTTSTSAFPATTGADGPHAIASQQVSGPSGTTTTSYGYNTAGQTSSVSGPSGSWQLTWGGPNRDPNKLTSMTSGSAAASYVYDASGNLLQQTDNGTTTLYLPDEQITSTGGAQSAVRYYSLSGVAIAARTSAGDVQYLFGDTHGTSTIAVSACTLVNGVCTMPVTRRWYDPNGNPIGTPPPTWPGNHGFVGGTTDTITGLTNLGAREYNPATAAFVSPDPILTPYNPADLNPYAYAADNPATKSDATGLCEKQSVSAPCYSPPPTSTPSGSTPTPLPCTPFCPPGVGTGTTTTTSTTNPVSVVGTVVFPTNYPHLQQIQQIYNQTYRGLIRQGWGGTGLESRFHALLIACELNPAVCGSTLMNALWRAGPSGTAMTPADGIAMQQSGQSPMNWLQSHGAQLIMKNSIAISGAVGLFRPGRLGGPAHKAMVNDIVDAFEAAGYDVETEFKVNTPGGFKPYRAVDVAVLDPQTGDPVEFVQVGLQTQGGIPVMRETLAMSDIVSPMIEGTMPEVPITFVPYNGPP